MSLGPKLSLALKLTTIALIVTDGLVAMHTTGTIKLVAALFGLASIAAFIALTVFTGGGDPDKQPGLNPPPLRWGGGN